IDADMVLADEVIAECLAMADSGCEAAVIPEIFVGTSFWAKVRGFERAFYDDVWWMEAARWYRRELFSTLGGFYPGMLAGEDWDLDQRAREVSSVGRIAAPIYHQEGDIGLRQLLRKKRHYAGTLS